MADHGGKDLGGSTGGVGRQMGFGRGEADGGRGEEEMGFLLWVGVVAGAGKEGMGRGFLLWGGWDIKWG